MIVLANIVVVVIVGVLRALLGAEGKCLRLLVLLDIRSFAAVHTNLLLIFPLIETCGTRRAAGGLALIAIEELVSGSAGLDALLEALRDCDELVGAASVLCETNIAGRARSSSSVLLERATLAAVRTDLHIFAVRVLILGAAGGLALAVVEVFEPVCAGVDADLLPADGLVWLVVAALSRAGRAGPVLSRAVALLALVTDVVRVVIRAGSVALLEVFRDDHVLGALSGLNARLDALFHLVGAARAGVLALIAIEERVVLRAGADALLVVYERMVSSALVSADSFLAVHVEVILTRFSSAYFMAAHAEFTRIGTLVLGLVEVLLAGCADEVIIVSSRLVVH